MPIRRRFFGLYTQWIALAVSLVMHKTHKTPRPIATVLVLAAVGVVNHLFKIDVGRGCGVHAQNLTRTNPKWRLAKRR